MTKRYGHFTALDDVGFSIRRGEILGLIGPNGAGKTTTFNACTGLVRVESGSVHLGGHDVTHAPPHRRWLVAAGTTAFGACPTPNAVLPA
jgi:branched-chain amino acid transport system ATP-binding protein